MKVLVTGATGYIGKSLLPFLQQKGYHIRALVRNEQHVHSLRQKKVEPFLGDLTQKKSLRGIEKGIDYVCHLAVMGHLHGRNGENQYRQVNVEGSLNLLNRFSERPLEKFLFTSSTAALGLIQGIATEKDTAIPPTAYGLSKFQAEEALAANAFQYGIPLVTVRLSHVYGPGERRDLYRIIRLMKKGVFPQIGLKPNLYPAVYIDDAVAGLYRALTRGRPRQTYFVTDRVSHDTRNIRKAVRAYWGKSTRLYPWIPKWSALMLFHVMDKLAEVTGFRFPVSLKNIQYLTAQRRFSIKKAQEELGYNPVVHLEEGIQRTLDEYVENGLL